MTNAPPADYWPRFRARYGVIEAPFENAGLPLGIRETPDGSVTFDCLLCHAGRVGGETLIGAPNTELDLQGLAEDLNALAARFGMAQPMALVPRTGAAGANDAMGLGFSASTAYGPADAGINVEHGFQRPPAWWTLRFKQRTYVDGSGSSTGYRTMMATFLAFGLTFAELQAKEQTFVDLHHYLLSLPVPQWPFGALDAARWSSGRQLFEQRCASCHGLHHDAPPFVDQVIASKTVGTDPLREVRLGAPEVAWVNASWFGQPPMTETPGYLAPPLLGLWARAPYLHNGSVPTLRALLEPSARPARWRRTGNAAQDYDVSAVGWRTEAVTSATDRATVQGRKIYDTTVEGLSNAGHLYGADLDGPQRTALLEYLKSL